MFTESTTKVIDFQEDAFKDLFAFGMSIIWIILVFVYLVLFVFKPISIQYYYYFHSNAERSINVQTKSYYNTDGKKKTIKD